MEKKRLDEIKKRFNNTTGGNWKVYETDEGPHIGTVEDHPQLQGPNHVVVMATSVKDKTSKRIIIGKNDANFIAESKRDMQWLIEQAEKVEQFREAFQQLKATLTSETHIDESISDLLFKKLENIEGRVTDSEIAGTSKEEEFEADIRFALAILRRDYKERRNFLLNENLNAKRKDNVVSELEVISSAIFKIESQFINNKR